MPFSLQVDLVELRMCNGNFQNIRLYKSPSEMDVEFPESRMVNPNEDQSGISERRIGINQPIPKAQNKAPAHNPFRKLDEKKRNGLDYADILSDRSTLKELLAPNRRFKLFKAVKRSNTIILSVVYREATEQKKGHYDSRSAGGLFENAVSTTPDSDGETLYGLYHARLGSNDADNHITITYTGQVDGLKFSTERELRLKEQHFEFTEEDLSSTVEVKANSRSLFYPMNVQQEQRYTRADKYYYEHIVMRGIWAQCRLSGLDTCLCGITRQVAGLSDLRIKEVWAFNVNACERILQRAKNCEDSWKRAFPKNIFTDAEIQDLGVDPNNNFQPWTEEKAYQDFHAALATVKNDMERFNLDEGDCLHFIYDFDYSQMKLRRV